MTNIKVDNVFFSYELDKPVLKGISFEILPNEIVGLLGTNGSGKTTLFKLITGLLYPNEGNIVLDNLSVFEAGKEALKNVAYIPDEPLLYNRFSALENMNLFAILWGVEGETAKEKTEVLLNEVGLWDVRNQWVNSYSRGMKQKLALCTALIHDPKILIMDEPFTGLDINGLLWARKMLKGFIKEGNRSIVFTSHTPEVIEALAGRVIIIKEGNIVHDEKRNPVIETETSLIEIFQNSGKDTKLII